MGEHNRPTTVIHRKPLSTFHTNNINYVLNIIIHLLYLLMNIINKHAIPIWAQRLEEGDLQFVKQLVLASGSLKQLANEYDVSYPTIRQRLNSPFESRVRTLVADRAIEPSIGKELLELHREKLGGNND